MRHTLLAIIWSVLLGFSPSLAQPQKFAEWDNGVTERWWVELTEFPRQELDTAIERWNRIEADNKNGNSHEWAGAFFNGDETHGAYLRWSRQTGFIIAHVDKCAARLTGLSYGKIEISPASVGLMRLSGG